MKFKVGDRVRFIQVSEDWSDWFKEFYGPYVGKLATITRLPLRGSNQMHVEFDDGKELLDFTDRFELIEPSGLDIPPLKYESLNTRVKSGQKKDYIKEGENTMDKPTKLAKDFKNGRPDADYERNQLQMGTREETEHTDNLEIAESIAKDHLDKIPDYYTRLMKMENEAKAEMKEEKPKEMAEEFVKREEAKRAKSLNEPIKTNQESSPQYCVCLKCNERVKHNSNISCSEEICRCGSKMIGDRG